MNHNRRSFFAVASATLLAAGGCTRAAPEKAAGPANPPLPDGSKITVNVPLFDELWELDGEIRKRFPDKRYHGLDALGVMFSKPDQLKREGYYRTPTNTVAFCNTGGDGTHFSFLVRDARVDADSPIVLTAPANSLNENHILADNFRTFLCMGLRRGYFAMQQFAFDPKEALRVYGTPDWHPTEKQHISVGYMPGERQQKVIAFVAEQLKLEPFAYTEPEFQVLQDRFKPLLQIPS
jgi:hypothetical protein